MSSGIDIDTPLIRRGTNSYKWDFHPNGDPEVLPMWIADMDFPSPPAVAEAITKRAEHPIFGYTFASDSYHEATRKWYARRHGWQIDEQTMLAVPSVMEAVRAAILALSEPGDAVIVQTPVYHPFFDSIESNGRRILDAPLALDGHRYAVDLAAFEAAITPKTRMLLLCSPHNPVGRVWERAELEAVARVCRKHEIIVIADEIHADILMPGSTFVPFSLIAPEICVSTISPSKTFNIAGLPSAHVVVPEKQLRGKLDATFKRLGFGPPNLLSLAAAEAAYTRGEEWLDVVIEQVAANDQLLRKALAARLPEVSVVPLEGTYIAWLDFRKLRDSRGMSDQDLKRRLWSGAKLGLSDGTQFGANGSGFYRMILAAPKTTIEDAIERLVKEFN